MSRVNWRELLNWSKEELEDIRFLGYSYIRQGKYEIAQPLFEALAVLHSEDAYDAQTLGAIYLEMNEPEKATEALEQALKINADHGPTLLNLMKALFMMGKKEEGLKLAHMLTHESDPSIANSARALILAHSSSKSGGMRTQSARPKRDQQESSRER